MDMDDQLADPMAMLSHFSMSTIIVSFVFGVIGLFVFRHAKKNLNYPLLFTSIAMMIYPMFTAGWILDWGVGIFLCALAYYLNENHNLTS
jgi:hypothetical protein